MPKLQEHAPSVIFAHGVLAAETVASELRERLVSRLSSSYEILDMSRLVQIARTELDIIEPVFAQMLADAEIAAWIAGMDGVARRLPGWGRSDFSFADLAASQSNLFTGDGLVFPTLPGDGGIILPPTPPQPPAGDFPIGGFGDDDEPIIRFPIIEKARDRLLQRQVLTRPEFDKLTGEAKRKAFTIAYESSEETIGRVRDTLAESLREGTSLSDFRERLEESVGKGRYGAAHLETVYRTGVQQAFHDGHDELLSNPIVNTLFPYTEYLAIHDARTRHNHLALEKLGIEGTNIYRTDDPFWNEFAIPWDYNCRCGKNALTLDAAARKGLKEAQRWLRTGVAPHLESRLPHIPFRPDPGFSRRGVLSA